MFDVLLVLFGEFGTLLIQDFVGQIFKFFGKFFLQLFYFFLLFGIYALQVFQIGLVTNYLIALLLLFYQ